MLRTDNSEINALIDLSARIGGNPLLVQAGSGNTSLKHGAVLWIKASGKWLARAGQEETFLPVDLDEARRHIQRHADFTALHPAASGDRLTSSIETAMHAILPHRVVIHVHSVNAVAWAVRRDAPLVLRERLAGLDWSWIRYVPSGLPLAQEIQRTIARPPQSNVFVLGNHGLVVCGETCEAAETLLDDVERRLATEPRLAPKPDSARLGRTALGSEWRLPEPGLFHPLATDLSARGILSGGILFPCQAIFLGPSLPVWRGPDSVSEAADAYRRRHGVRPPFLLVEGSGVLVHEEITLAETEMLGALTQIVQRVDPRAPIRYLNRAELRHVLSADAHRYRGLVENSCAGGPALAWRRFLVPSTT